MYSRGATVGDAVVSAAGRALPAFVPATRFSLPSFAAAGLSFAALGALLWAGR